MPHPQKNKEIRRRHNKVIKRGLSIPKEYQQTKYTAQIEDEEARNTKPSQRDCLGCFNLGKKKEENNEH